MATLPPDELTDPSGPAEEELDRFLIEAFESELPALPASSELIPQTAPRPIQGTSGGGARITLPELPEDSAPTSTMAAPERADDRDTIGRYEVLEQIGQGGMGIVMRSRDTELGRDLALKILMRRHLANRSIVRRFIEEAQIGAQLQHPGILPVYELGVSSDATPFFTMKLVKGRTLATILHERSDADRHRQRILAIFLQVCQTIAYAHARGVIHRDLKPSNIMVGSYGEVHVLDWGLAKVRVKGDEMRQGGPEGVTDMDHALEVVRRAEPGANSEAGSVLGTLAYMAPEQARGEYLAIDERSDVFALGGILCEIITGEPPYLGKTLEELRRQAAAADLDPALARLDACGADGELVALVKQCLTPDRRSRARDAKGVAETIATYLAAVEERARNSQLAAAAASAKATEERKARRLALALAASVVVAVGIGVSTLIWVREQRLRRMAETEQKVRAVLEEATLARGAQRFPEAIRALENARTLIEAMDSTKALRREVNSLGDLIQSEADAAQLRLDRNRENGELLTTLDDIRTPQGGLRVDVRSGTPMFAVDWATVEASYASAFHAVGLRPESLPVEDAAQGLRERGLGVELSAFLDEWRQACRASGLTERGDHLAQVILATDDDEVRTRFRQALYDRDVSKVKAFAANTDLRTLPAATLNVLASALDQLKCLDESIAVGRVAQRIYPDNFAFNASLATRLSRLRLPAAEEAIVFWRTAVALEPKSLQARVELALSLGQVLHAPEAAVNELEETLRLYPGDERLLSLLGQYYLDSGNMTRAVESCRENIRLHPRSAIAYSDLGRVLARQGDFQGALGAMREGLEIKRADYVPYLTLASLHVWRGHVGGAARSLRGALRLMPGHAIMHRMIGDTLSLKGSFDERRREYADALRLDPSCTSARTNLGVLLLEQQSYAEAIAEFRVALAQEPDKATSYSNIAWTLVICSDPSMRDPVEAVRFAEQAAQLEPELADHWYTLGAAYYRAGDWGKALASLEASLQKQPVVDRSVAFFLAMTFWQLSLEDQARDWFSKATTWTDKSGAPRPVENEAVTVDRGTRKRIRAEAAALLGIEDQ